MKLKMKHLRHPFRTAIVAGNLSVRYLDIKRSGDRGGRRFHGDPRYDLDNVSLGFASRPTERTDDASMLERICNAYCKAVQCEERASDIYQASPWWRQLRQTSLGPVIHALRTHDLAALSAMYRNFYRDPCAAGLIDVPYRMSRAYFSGNIKDIHRRFYLGDALHGIDCWIAQTGGHLPLRELAGPPVGNPFGVVIDGTLVRSGAAFHHYSAHRISELLNSEARVVVEIGGGYGGMAYYLLRNCAGIKYVGFDVPESLALASYYLMRSFPRLNFLLYGEKPVAHEDLARADVALLPLSEMEDLPTGHAHIAFSSHSMSDIAHEAMDTYLATIGRIARERFLYIGNGRGAEMISGLTAASRPSLRLMEQRPSAWNNHRFPNSGEVECLYALTAQTAEIGAPQSSYL